eukprot:GSMAST32.ASY1.ANO1.1876.1 assembled CDS
MSKKNIAVIGGGISGCVSAAFLRMSGHNVTIFESNAFLGGRAITLQTNSLEASTESCSSISNIDLGAQFITVTDPRFRVFINSPIMQGILQPWSQNFSVIGCTPGHSAVLQRDIALQNFKLDVAKEYSNDEVQLQRNAPMNFCGFLECERKAKSVEESRTIYTGRDGVGSFCYDLLKRTGVHDIVSDAYVKSVDFQQSSLSWSLTCDRENSHGPFDFCILANNDAKFAADTIDKLMCDTTDHEMRDTQVREIINDFTLKLRELEKTNVNCMFYFFSISILFSYEVLYLTDVPFDAASLQGSLALSFLSRDSSKPGKYNTYEGSTNVEEEFWVVQSTPEFAAWIDSFFPDIEMEKSQTIKLQKAEKELWSEFKPTKSDGFDNKINFPKHCFVETKRWEKAFFETPMKLNENDQNNNDAVTFKPWCLALAADYLGEIQCIQSAALSGLMSADRINQWISLNK